MSLQSFLDEIHKSLKTKDGQRIADLIHLDVESLPSDRQRPYVQLNSELASQYPTSNDAALLQRCRAVITPEEFGTFSTSFSESISQYFAYLRDIGTADNLTKALEIRQLTSQCVGALGDSIYGVVMVPIVLSFSRTLAFIATQLDRNPQLLRQRAQQTHDTTTNSRTSFVEDAANVVRDAFIKCLAGSPGTPRTSRPQPDDKRIGIYLTANSTLKLLFRCLKQRNAQQIFSSIDAQSPPLTFYPAAQRVTYLYYLGRYHFANNHFLRASAALTAAHTHCHRDAHTHLRLILTYLIASNLIIGLLPSPQLFNNNPHLAPLYPIFAPLIKALRSGDIGLFHSTLSLPTPHSPLPNPNATFLLSRRIHLQLLNRLEPFVYRSLIRTTFRITGFHAEGEDRKIPFLRLQFVRAAARFSLSRAPIPPGTLPHTGVLDAEFAELDQALAETNFDFVTGVYDSASSHHQNDNPFHPPETEDAQSPTMPEIESTFLSLIQQGLLRGFVLHNSPRFAIPGAAQKGGWRSGFPNVHRAVLERQGVVEGEGAVAVPGWVKESAMAGGVLVAGAGGGGGRVVRLSGVKAVGVGAS